MGNRPRAGDRVLFVGLANTFRGQLGRVVSAINSTRGPRFMIRVDGDTYPMCFDPSEVRALEEEPNMSGAE